MIRVLIRNAEQSNPRRALCVSIADATTPASDPPIACGRIAVGDEAEFNLSRGIMLSVSEDGVGAEEAAEIFGHVAGARDAGQVADDYLRRIDAASKDIARMHELSQIALDLAVAACSPNVSTSHSYAAAPAPENARFDQLDANAPPADTCSARMKSAGLPSHFQLGDRVRFSQSNAHVSYDGVIKAVRFSEAGVQYDIARAGMSQPLYEGIDSSRVTAA